MTMGTVAYLGFIYFSKEGAKRRRCPEGGVWWRGMKMTGSHQKPWDTDFTVQSRNEAYKNSARNELSKNSRSDQRGALASSPPWIRHCLSIRFWLQTFDLARVCHRRRHISRGEMFLTGEQGRFHGGSGGRCPFSQWNFWTPVPPPFKNSSR